MATNQATKNRVRKPSPINGQILPDGFEKHPERRNNGSWKKTDTARYKLEQMLKLTKDQLLGISENPDAPLFEKKLAYLLLQEPDWRVVEGMLNQVYGQPRQRLEVEPVQPKPLIDLTEEKK